MRIAEVILCEIVGLPDPRVRRRMERRLARKTSTQIPYSTGSNSFDDIITEDGILCSILSKLTLREAVQASLISPRWTSLWTHLPKLVFRSKYIFDDQTLQSIYEDSPLTTEEKIVMLGDKTNQFIRFVDSAIQQFQDCSRVSKLDKFLVRYFLHNTHSHHLDAWVRFAVSLNSKRLILELHKPFSMYFGEKVYDFPCHLLRSSFFLEELSITYCSLRQASCMFDGLRNLKMLHLSNVDATEEDITGLLSNCSRLEILKLYMIRQLTRINISRPLNLLQSFVLKGCDGLMGEISIVAPNLRNFGYFGHPVGFNFKQSSNLLDAFISLKIISSEPSLDAYLNKLSNLPQLRDLRCRLVGNYMVPNLPKRVSKFAHLRRLDWRWELTAQKMSLRHLATVLDSAPFLEVLNLGLFGHRSDEITPESLEKYREMIPKRPHTHMKTLKFLNYYWDKWHVVVTLYLIKNAIALEKMEINGYMELEETTTLRLRRELPAKVELSILCN